MFKNQKGKHEKIDWQTTSEKQLNGDILCSLYMSNKKSHFGVFFRKKKGEKKFVYDDLIMLEKFKG